MEQGEIINGLKSKMWIERYGKEGEFTIIGYARTGLKDLLPEGTYISHVDSTEIMIVENHEINGDRENEALITITGRSFETLLEQRVAEPIRAYPHVSGGYDYEQPSQESHWQIVNFINGLISPGHVYYADDAIDYVSNYSWIPDGAVSDEILIKHGRDGLTTVYELLNGEGMDLFTIRPGLFTRGSAAIPDENTVFAVHKGVDRSADLVLSFDMGEIESADYFWSLKPKKTLAVVQGKWVGVRLDIGGPTGVKDKRRMLYVDASGMDNLYNAAPTGATLTKIQNAMLRRGWQALMAQRSVNLVNPNVSKEGTHLTYRKDYNVGDILMVNGEYNTSAPFRVTEYVEFEDETGRGGYPTLDTP